MLPPLMLMQSAKKRGNKRENPQHFSLKTIVGGKKKQIAI